MKVKLNIGGSKVYVHDAPSQAHYLLSKKLSAPNPKAFWTNKKRTWPGATKVADKWELYESVDQKFPRGLICLAIEVLDSMGLDLEFGVPPSVEEVLSIDFSSKIYDGHGLKDYEWQLEAPREFFNRTQRIYKERGLVVSMGVMSIPTRGGKTICGLRAASAFVKTHCVLYLVNKSEAQKDIIDTWKAHFDTAPVFDDVTHEFGLHVLTYQSAVNRDLSHFDFVIGDEIHQAGADTFYATLMRCENAVYKLGMTGTPSGRSDGKDIYITAACGEVFFTVPRSTIINSGLCASGEVWVVRTPGILDQKSWPKLEKFGIVNNEERNEKLIRCAESAWKGLNKEGQIMAMVQKHDHGELLAKQLSKASGYSVPYVSGLLDKTARRKLYDQITNGSIRVFVASNIYNDSVSLPHVRILINAAGGKSQISTRQRLGRALTGDKEVVIVDSIDEMHPVLHNHSLERVKAYRMEGYVVKEWVDE